MSTPVLSIRVLNIQEEGLIFQDKPRTEKNKLQNPSGHHWKILLELCYLLETHKDKTSTPALASSSIPLCRYGSWMSSELSGMVHVALKGSTASWGISHSSQFLRTANLCYGRRLVKYDFPIINPYWLLPITSLSFTCLETVLESGFSSCSIIFLGIVVRVTVPQFLGPPNLYWR